MNDDFRGKDAAPGLTRVSEKDMAGGLPDGRRAWQCLSGGALKLIGAAMMVVDHLHQMFYNVWAPDWFTCIGRPVAAMFLFMSAEGFAHTRSKGRYLLRLFIGFEFMGLVSYLLSRALPNENVVLMNNIFGTLLLAAVYMLLTDWLKEGFKKRKPLLVLSAAALMVLIVAASVGMMLLMNAPALPHLALALLVSCAPNVILTEGGFPLVLLGVLFYLLRKHRLAQMAVVAGMGVLSFITSKGESVQYLMLFAAVPMFLYNGERGKVGKYFFYLFYPTHIYLLYIIAYLVK